MLTALHRVTLLSSMALMNVALYSTQRALPLTKATADFTSGFSRTTKLPLRPLNCTMWAAAWRISFSVTTVRVESDWATLQRGKASKNKSSQRMLQSTSS